MTKAVPSGVSQGSVFDVVLFLIYVSRLLFLWDIAGSLC